MTRANRSSEPSNGQLGFNLQFVRGKALLCLEKHEELPWLRVDRLEMQLPDVAFPFDLAGGLSRFRSKRCQLVSLRLTLDIESLIDRIGRAELAGSIGFRNLELHGESRPVLTGEIRVARQSALFSVRPVIDRAERGVGLRLTNLRAYGKLPIPVPLVGLALLAAAGVPRQGERIEPGGVELVGPQTVAGDLAALALWETLVPHGWKVADGSEVELRRWSQKGLRITFDFGLSLRDEAEERSEREWQVESDLEAEDEAKQGPPADARQGESLLASGRIAEAFDFYWRRVEAGSSRDRFVIRRAMELSVCSSATAKQAEELAKEALEAHPNWGGALLTLAVARQQQGEVLEAAAAYSKLASADEREGLDEEAVCASRACGRLLRSADPEQAIGLYSRILTKRPGDQESTEALIELYERQGRWRELVPLLRNRASEGDRKQRIDAQIALGRCYLSCLADPLRARAELEKAIRLDGRRVEAWLGLVDAHLAGGDAKRALAALERLEGLGAPEGGGSSQLVELHLRASRVRRALGEGEKALERMQAAVELAPDRVDLLTETLEMAKEAGRWDVAAETCHALAEKSDQPTSRRVEASVEEARILWKEIGDEAGAQLALDSALASDPTDRQALGLAAELAAAQDRHEELVRILSMLIDTEADEAARDGLEVRRANSMLATGEGGLTEETAADLLEIGEKRGPHSLEAMETLAVWYRSQGETGKLVSVLEAWVEQASGDPSQAERQADVYLELAELASRESSDRQRVRRALVRAAQLDPGRIEPLSRLAGVLEEEEDPRELEGVLLRLANLLRSEHRHSELASVLGRLGAVRLRLERPEQATEPLREAARLDPESLGVRADLGEAELRQGNFERAEQAYSALWEAGKGGAVQRARVAAKLAEIHWSLDARQRSVEFCRAALDLGVAGHRRVVSWRRICDWAVSEERWREAADAYQGLAEDDEIESTPDERATALYTAADICRKRLEDEKEAARLCWAVLEHRPDHRGALNALETLLARSGRFEEVARVLERKIALAEQRSNERVTLLARLARLEAEELGRVQAARRTYELALEQDPDHTAALLFVARDDFRRKDWRSSLRTYKRLLELDVDPEREGTREQRELEAEAHRKMALAAAELGWGAALDEHAEWVLDREPGDVELLAVYQRHLREQERWEDLAPLIRRRAELSSAAEGVELKLELAELLASRLEDAQQAAEVYREVLRQEPHQPVALVHLATILDEEGRQEERLRVLERLADVTPQARSEHPELVPPLEDTYLELAEAAHSLQRDEVSRKWLNKRVELAPADPRAARLALEMARKEGDKRGVDEALAKLAEAEDEPEARDRAMLDRARWRLEELDDGQGALDILAQGAQANDEALSIKASALCSLDRWQEAYDCYEELATRAQQVGRGDEMDHRRRLLEIAEGPLNDDELAEQQGLRILEIRPDEPDVAGRLAELYRRQGDALMMRRMLERRLRALETIEGKSSESVALMLDLARLWRDEPNKGLERAEGLCRRAMELEPDRAAAAKLLTEILAAKGEVEEAAELLEALVDREAEEAEEKGVGDEERARFHLELAELYDRALDDGPASRKHARTAAGLLSGPSRITALETWAHRAARDENWAEAAEAGEQLRDGRGSDRDLEMLAEAYERLGRMDEAIQTVATLHERLGEVEAMRSWLRRLYASAGRNRELAEELEAEAGRQGDPARAVDLLKAAAQHYSSRQEGFEQAERCLRAALEMSPADRDLFERLHELLSNSDQVSRFFTHLRAVVDRRQGDDRSRCDILCWAAGVRLETGGNDAHGEAAELLEMALEVCPDNLEAWKRLCDLYEEGEPEQLVSCLERVVELEEGELVGKTKIKLAEAHLERLDQPQLAADILEGEARGSKDEDVLSLYARALIRADRLQEAEDVLGRLAALADEAWSPCVEAADLAARRQDPVAERGWLLEAIEHGGPGLELSRRLVRLERKTGDRRHWARALESLLDYEQEPERRAEAIGELARVVLSDSPDRSLELLREAVSLVPEDVSIRRQLAEAAMKREELELAIEVLADLHQSLGGDEPDVRGDISVQMADAMAGMGEDPDAARDLYRRAADEFVDGERRAHALGRTAELARQTSSPGLEEEALRALEEAFDEREGSGGDDCVEIRLRLVELCLERGAWGEAVALCDKLSEAGVSSPSLRKHRAAALEALGRWAEAADSWVEAAGEEPDVDFLLRAASLRRDRLEDPEGALELLGRALTKDPTDTDVMSQIESLCRQHERWEELVELKELSLQGRADQERARILHAMAVIRERKLADPDGAATLLARAHSLDPDFWPVLRPLGEYHFQNREWEPARDYFRRALDAEQASAEAKVEILDRLARIERAESEWRAEIDYLRQAVELDPDRDELWNRAEEVLRRGDDRQGLFDLLARRAELSPGGQKAKRLFEAARLMDQEMGQPDRAIALYERAIEINPEALEPRQRLLELLRERGQWHALADRLQAELLLVEGPAKAQIADELASLYESKADDHVAAERCYRLAYREEPTNPKRIRSLADHLARQRRWEDLADFLEMSLDTVGLPDAAFSGFTALLGRTYLEKLGKSDKARDVFERARSRRALTSRSVELLSKIYWEKGLYDELASLLRQELKQMEDGARRYQLVAKLADLLEGKVGDQIGAADLRVQLYEVRPRRHRKHAERACELYLEHSRYEEAERLAADLAETADEDEKPEAELRWGLILLDYLGREEEAFEVLSRVIEARPDLARAHLALGRILFTRGQLDQALFHLEIVAAGEVQDKELSAEAHQLAGAAAEELKRPEDAQRHLEAAFEQDPTNDGVLRSLDRLYTATGQLDKLARVLGREIDVEADPEARAKLWYRRALLHRDILDDMPEAVRCLREAVGAAPHFVEAVSTLRQACAHTGDWALAAQLVDREIAVEQDPERLAELYVARGKLLEDKLHQPKRAQDAYAKAAELDPVNPKPVDELARLLALTGESSEAARATEKLVERQAGVKRGETFLRAAKLYLRGGEQSEAWRCWKEVLSDDDEESWLEASQAMSSSARSEAQSREMAELLEGCMGKASRDEVRVELLRHLIRLLVELDEPERAEPFAAELLRRVPADRTAFLHKRKMVEKRGELTQLRSLLEQRLEVAGSEEMVDLLFALGNLQYRELEDSEAAAATFDRLLEQDPGNKGALDARADIAYHTGDYPLAYELYESLGDDVSMLAADEKHARRGDIAEALGIDEEAIAHYERAVDTNPTNRGAWEALCRIHLFSERYERAVPALKKLTELVPVAEVDTTLEVRTQLVKALVYLGRIEEAERYLDKLRHLLAQDTVELRKLSLEVHQKLGRWEDAAADLDALVRLVDDPKLKAQILFREGELRLSQLDDAEGAADCYLKGADLDPAHLPTNRRLSEHYACEGDWKQLVEVCETLVENEPSDSNRAAAVARLAVGLVLEGGSEALQAPELLAKIDDGQLDPRHAVRILSDVSIGLKKKGFTMAPMSRVLDTLSSALGGETLESWLDEAVGLLAEKPADTGARRLVSRLSARLAKRSLGSQHAKVLRFVDPSDSAAMDGKAEGRSRGMVSNALDVDGPALPEDLRVPLRQALVALSAKLHGFGRTRPPGLDELASLHDGVSPLMAARIGSLLTRLRVSGVEVLIEEGEQVSVRAVDARPPVVVATTGACALGEEELVFLLARELEWVRSGSLFLRGRSGSDEEALCGALASLLGAEVEDDEISRLADELADWAEIPFSLDDASHDALRSAMTHHMKSPVDIGAYLKAEVRMAQRIGLLSCEDLGSALRAACAQVGGASALDEKNVAVREKLLASDPAIAELARFGVSGKYVKLMRRSTMSGY